MLTKRPLDKSVFEGATEKEWQQCYDMALEQGVLAMTFPAVSSLPKELRPSFTLWARWMAYTQNVVMLSNYKREIVKKIGFWLTEDGLQTTILKGFSLSALYPNPELREFTDIDIFSGKNYDAVNACFANHGIKVDSVDGHHAYLNVDGIAVEHHFAFTNTKVKNGLVGPEEALHSLVAEAQSPTDMQGIYYPNPVFTTLFVGWHAYEHFLQEKIQFRHIIDWMLSLNRLSECGAAMLDALKGQSKWGKFLDTLIAIALHQFNLPKDRLTDKELVSVSKISQEQEQRVLYDILYAPRTSNGINSTHRRINIAKRIIRNYWKYNEYAEISAFELLIKQYLGHIKRKPSKNV